MTVVNLTGRIVWGHPTKPQKKMKDKLPVMKDGQQVWIWSFGLAVPKDQANATAWPVMYAEALKGYPSGAFPPLFAWKYKDGDTAVDDQGKAYRDRTGYAGCWVFAISTEVQAVPVTQFDPATRRYVDFPNIKCGDYCEVQLNIVYHPAAAGVAGAKAGLYLNPNGVNFLGYGEPIISGPDAEQMFGNQPKALPAGASATPVGSSQAPGMAVPPIPPGPPGSPPAPPIAPVVAPPAPPPAAPPAPPATAYPSNPPAPPPPANDFVTRVAPSVMPAPPPSAPPAPPAPPPVDPNAPTIVRYDPATGKPVWRWPNGQEALGA